MYFLIVEDEFFFKEKIHIHVHIFKTIKFDLLLNVFEMHAYGSVVMSCLGVLDIGNLYMCMLYIYNVLHVLYM